MKRLALVFLALGFCLQLVGCDTKDSVPRDPVEKTVPAGSGKQDK